MKLRHTGKRSKKSGLPPGELVFVSNKAAVPTKVTAYLYDQKGAEEKQLKDVSELEAIKNSEKLIWINVDGLSNVEWVKKIGELFKLHPLALEDVMNQQQRPKREEFDEYLFVVVKALMLSQPEGSAKKVVDQEQISLFIGKKYLITFQEKPGDTLKGVRDRLVKPESRMCHFGSDYLAYSCLDTIVDKYFEVLETVGEDVEELESEIVEKVKPDTLTRLYGVKREVLGMRRIIWPTRELFGGLVQGESHLIDDHTVPFFRDIYSHCLEAVEMLEMQREMLSGLLDVYLSSISNRLNNVMRVLTVLTTVFMPLTVITGIYGMNFEHMPELHWYYGYYYVLGLMVVVTVLMLAIFKKQKWI